MTHATAEEVTTLWLVDGRPGRLVWSGVRWRVIDTPTPLSIPRPTRVRTGAADAGWRLTARNETTREARVLDVIYDGTAWHVARSYE